MQEHKRPDNRRRSFFARLFKSRIAWFIVIVWVMCTTYVGCHLNSSRFFRTAGYSNFYYDPNMSNDCWCEDLAARLPSGRIYLFGGTEQDSALPIQMVIGMNRNIKSEVYDPRTQKCTALPDSPFDFGERGARVMPLPSGKLFITGAIGSAGDAREFHPDMNSEDRQRFMITTALLFDPKSNKYTLLSHLRPVRYDNSATYTVLPNGKVLVIGGTIDLKEYLLRSGGITDMPPKKIGVIPSPKDFDTNKIQLFDPENDSISEVGNLNLVGELWGHAVNVIDNNRVLLFGGTESIYSSDPEYIKRHVQPYLLHT